jgi:hypothetical protein
MNTKTFLPLTAAILFAVCSGSMLLASQSYDANASAKTEAAVANIVDMPAVTVRPSVEDAAYYQANKIVDLAAVTVRPAAEDLAYFLADSTARIIDMPAVTVRPSAQDMQNVAIGAATLAQQLASR